MKKTTFLLSIILFAMTLFVGNVFATTDEGTLGDPTVETGIVGTLISAPTASPVAGTYTSTRSVTLTASGSQSIRYTVDGSTPTCSVGTVYSGTISVSSSKTIKAISCYPDGSSSSVASFAYTISGGGGGGGGSSSSDDEEEEEEEETTITTETGTGSEEEYNAKAQGFQNELQELERNRNSITSLKERIMLMLNLVRGKAGYESVEAALTTMLARIEALETEANANILAKQAEIAEAVRIANLFRERNRLEQMRTSIISLISVLEGSTGKETQRTALQALLARIEALKASIETQLENI
jgi:hypothetical protein